MGVGILMDCDCCHAVGLLQKILSYYRMCSLMMREYRDPNCPAVGLAVQNVFSHYSTECVFLTTVQNVFSHYSTECVLSLQYRMCLSYYSTECVLSLQCRSLPLQHVCSLPQEKTPYNRMCSSGSNFGTAVSGFSAGQCRVRGPPLHKALAPPGKRAPSVLREILL